MKLADWLTERARRWPATVNPHLFINWYTAVRTCPATHSWVSRTLGASAQAIREDRILYEAQATDGDIRRLCDLFGLTPGGAERYSRTTSEPTRSFSGSLVRWVDAPGWSPGLGIGTSALTCGFAPGKE